MPELEELVSVCAVCGTSFGTSVGWWNVGCGSTFGVSIFVFGVDELEAAGGGGGGGGGGGAETMNARIGFSITSGCSLMCFAARMTSPMITTCAATEMMVVTPRPFVLSLPADSMRTSSNMS